MSDNVIELNGKRYDAISGAYLGKSQGKAIPAVKPKGKTIDGVIRKKKPEQQLKPKPEAPKPKPPKQAAPAKVQAPKAKPRPVHETKQHLAAHKPAHSKTLMRSSVSKPKTTIKPAIKLQAPAAATGRAKTIVRKHSALAVDKQRLERASQYKKADSIDHFRATAAHTTKQHVPVVPVRTAPASKTISPAVHSHPSVNNNVLDKAIASADSHKQPAHKLKRQHGNMLNIGLIVAAVLLAVGLLVYLNQPRIAMYIASSQAGFSASMPGYSPTGYTLTEGVKRYGGIISTTYRSGANNYTLTQQSSAWNSQTLLDNTLALSGPHETLQQNGQTIYVYDKGTSAAWVNGSVRYDIAGNAELSSDDIAAIADSL